MRSYRPKTKSYKPKNKTMISKIGSKVRVGTNGNSNIIGHRYYIKLTLESNTPAPYKQMHYRIIVRKCYITDDNRVLTGELIHANIIPAKDKDGKVYKVFDKLPLSIENVNKSVAFRIIQPNIIKYLDSTVASNIGIELIKDFIYKIL